MKSLRESPASGAFQRPYIECARFVARLNCRSKPGWTASLTLLAASVLAAQDGPLTIFVYDYVGLPDATINELEARTRTLMLKAGVPVHIVQCGPHAAALPVPSEQDLRCSQLVFRIVRRPSGLQGKGSPLGLSIASGRCASLYARNIFEVAQRHTVQSGRVIAYALVHELTHLLLGPAHGPFGIMRASWGEAEAREMDQGRLTFAATEKAAFRSAVERDDCVRQTALRGLASRSFGPVQRRGQRCSFRCFCNSAVKELTPAPWVATRMCGLKPE